MTPARDNRIDRLFARCRKENRRALVIFLSAGDPSIAATLQAVITLTEAGADLVELGIPFSDPTADGPVIQAASQHALHNGFRLTTLLEGLAGLRRNMDIPCILFSYYNVVLQYGIARLARESGPAGLDGWLLVDLPREEAGEVQPHLDRAGIHRIPLVAPTTPGERIPYLLEGAGGFVYAITVKGITGARTEWPVGLTMKLDRIRALSPLPVAAGFGVSNPAMAAALAPHADAVVVGSLLVKTLSGPGRFEDNLARAADRVRALRQALRA